MHTYLSAEQLQGQPTQVLQAAIDRCSQGGGGRVTVAAGIHEIGTIWLRSRVELHLESGAVLRGSPRREDYNPDDIFPENEVFVRENTTGAHLIIAYQAEQVSISGRGTIDGNSSVFFGELSTTEEEKNSYRSKQENFPILDWRPSQMIFFCKCHQVNLQGVSLLNAPYWTCFFLGCQDVQVSGLRIENPPQTANGDGLDIDCCENVTVSDCLIRSGDDCITLRGNQRPLKSECSCKNVVVSNCVLSTPCNAIRIGVGDGFIHDCLFQNIVITDARTGINLVCRYGKATPRGSRIERIRFANFRINAIAPIQTIVGDGAQAPTGIRDLDFSGFTVNSSVGIHIGGESDCPIERIRCTDWNLEVSGGGDNSLPEGIIPDPFPLFGMSGRNGTPTLPSALLIRHARDIELRDFRIRWKTPLGKVWEHALLLEDVEGILLRNATTPPPFPEMDGLVQREVGNLRVLD